MDAEPQAVRGETWSHSGGELPVEIHSEACVMASLAPSGAEPLTPAVWTIPETRLYGRCGSPAR